MTNTEYLKSIGYTGEIIDDRFLQNAIECYHAYFGKDKAEVIIRYAEQKRLNDQTKG